MQPLSDVFTTYLLQNAGKYFPSLKQPVNVVCRAEEERPISTLLRYEIDREEGIYRILVKIRPAEDVFTDYLPERPRRYLPEYDDLFGLESNALIKIEKVFSSLNDARFGVIRVLDTLPDYRAIIMMESCAPDLRTIFASQNRLQRLYNKRDVLPIFRNAGAWLYHFHAIEPEEHVDICYDRRDDYIGGIRMFAEFLAEVTGDDDYFHMVVSTVSKIAQTMLPDNLPTGRAHVDFTLRNILVEEDNRITVIDTLAKWHTSIYEDIGYFLVRLNTNQLQVFSQGLAYSDSYIRRCRTEFLRGYFGLSTIPFEAVNLYEILALLDQWSSIASRRRNAQFFKLKAWVRFNLTNNYFKRVLNSYLHQLDDRASS